MSAGLAWFWSLLSLGAGIALGIQGPLNAGLARGLGSPVAAAALSCAVAALVLALILLAGGAGAAFGGWRSVPPAYFVVGGCLGALFMAVASASIQRLGAGAFLALAIAGQLAAAVAIDHFGLLGLAARELTPGRGLGLACLLAGALLVRLF